MRRFLPSLLAGAAGAALIFTPAAPQGGGGGQGGGGQGGPAQTSPGGGDLQRDRGMDQTRDQDKLGDQDRDRDQLRDQDRDRLYLGAKDRLREHDRDGDGRFDETEFRNWHENAFRAFDNDESGGFSLQDYQAVRLGAGPKANASSRALERTQLRKTERFRLMDGDGDGVVTRTEYMKFGEINFLDADANDDGRLTFKELQNFHRNM